MNYNYTHFLADKTLYATPPPIITTPSTNSRISVELPPSSSFFSFVLDPS